MDEAPVSCLVACGGNIGDVPSTLRLAGELLASDPGVSQARLSRLFRTVPVGANAGGEFWNAGILLSTTLSPHDLLDLLLLVEQRLGRQRTARWGPRTVDLDLAYYGDQTVSSARLNVPHPAAWYRRFVLDPLVDLDPHRVDPVHQCSLQSLLGQLEPRPLPVGICLPPFPSPAVANLPEQLQARFPELQVHVLPTELMAGPPLPLRLWIGELPVTQGSLISTAVHRVVPLKAEGLNYWQQAIDTLTAVLDRPFPVDLASAATPSLQQS